MKKLLLISTTVLGLTVAYKQTNAQNITANFTATTVCLNNPTCFTDLSTSPTYSITSWYWIFDFSTSTLQNPCHTFTSPGTYTVTLIVTNSNGDKDTVQNPVTVYQNPTFNFTYSANGDTIIFMSTNPPVCFYFWDFGDGDTSIVQNPQHIYSTNGTYTVCYTETTCNGCQTTKCQQVNITTGIVNETTNSTTNIFPNPFSTSTTLQTNESLRNATLTVYNSLGQEVKEIKNISGKAIIFSRDNLPSGLYFLRLADGDKIYTNKLVITDK